LLSIRFSIAHGSNGKRIISRENAIEPETGGSLGMGTRFMRAFESTVANRDDHVKTNNFKQSIEF
jgi:hypothetical protein